MKCKNVYYIYLIITIILCLLTIISFLKAEKSCDNVFAGEGYYYAMTGGLDGIYSSDNYIVINTEGKSSEEIMSIFFHELTHKEVYEDYTHFCYKE